MPKLLTEVDFVLEALFVFFLLYTEFLWVDTTTRFVEVYLI